MRRLIVFRRQMFGRIFAISDRVRAYFAPVRVLSRVAERRAKKNLCVRHRPYAGGVEPRVTRLLGLIA